MQLNNPTPAIISTYITRFESEGYGLTARSIRKLFHVFPKNDQLEEVLLKVTAVNGLFSTNIFAIGEVAEHIFRLKIDPCIDEKSLDVVEKIATIQIKGKIRRNYSFASKYCSFHLPEVYPIYDGYVENLIWNYQKAIRFADFERGELQQYPRYKEIIEQFRGHFGLEQFSLEELDHFLWLYGVESYSAKKNDNN